MTTIETRSTEFIASILDELPDATIWVHPVRKEGKIVDFEVGYANKAANLGINHPLGSLCGLRILQHGVPSPQSAPSNFQHFLDVYEKSETAEYTFMAHYAGRQFETLRRKLHDGVLSTTRDRSAQREAERKEKEKTELLDGIVWHAPVGLAVYDSVRNEAGAIADFRLRLCNAVLHQLTGITEDERRSLTLRQLMDVLNASAHLERYLATVETGGSFAFEYYSPRSERWLQIAMVTLGDGFLVLISDINELKQTQEALRQQSAYLSGILDASLNAVVTMQAIRDEAGNVVDLQYTQVNKTFLDWLSKTESDVMNKTLLQLFPVGLEEVFELYKQVLITGTSVHRQVPFHNPYIQSWYDLRVARLDADTIVATFNDITSGKLAHLQVEKSANALKAVFDASRAGMFTLLPVKNEAGEVIEFRFGIVNQAVGAYIGQAAEVLTGAFAGQYFPAYHSNGLFRIYKETYLTGRSQSFDFHYEDGYNVHFNINVVKMGDAVLVTFTDQTTLKQLQQALEEKIRQLEDSNVALEEFAYAASHDLQEPLRKVHFFSDKLRRDLQSQLRPEQIHMFSRIESAAARMRVLIEDLLSYSRASAVSSEWEPVDLASILQQVLQDLEATIADKGAEIDVAALPVVQGVERQLQQMLQNLVSNAIKYHKPDMAPVIRIRSSVVELPQSGYPLPADAKGTYHLVEVMDNGIGFRPEEAEKIFKVFQRLHGRAEYEGTGVGLSIVQKVVLNHKGFIQAEGRPGEGAVFRIFLPA